MERFWSKVDKTPGQGPQGECWIWTACLRSKITGYGAFRFEGKIIDAHRFAYELQNGAIEEGMDVCHTCDVRLCVRGSHLFQGTRQINVQDMMKKGRGMHHKLRVVGSAGTAWCYRCKVFKSLDQFNRDRGRWDGTGGTCRDCEHVRWKTYYQRKRKLSSKEA